MTSPTWRLCIFLLKRKRSRQYDFTTTQVGRQDRLLRLVLLSISRFCHLQITPPLWTRWDPQSGVRIRGVLPHVFRTSPTKNRCYDFGAIYIQIALKPTSFMRPPRYYSQNCAERELTSSGKNHRNSVATPA